MKQIINNNTRLQIKVLSFRTLRSPSSEENGVNLNPIPTLPVGVYDGTLGGWRTESVGLLEVITEY